MDDHKVLGLSAGVDFPAIRTRYLELVRQHPPDRDPDRFAEIRAAYEALSDPAGQMKSWLFDLKLDRTPEQILSETPNVSENRPRYPTTTLLSIGRMK